MEGWPSPAAGNTEGAMVYLKGPDARSFQFVVYGKHSDKQYKYNLTLPGLFDELETAAFHRSIQ